MAPQSSDPSAGIARRRRTRLAAVSAGTIWAAALPVLALTVPVYQQETVTSDSAGADTVTTGSATLVDENGSGVLVVLLLPLIVAVAVGLLLAAAPRWRPAIAVAWALTGLLGVLTVLGLLSIGFVILPVTIALVVACAHAPRA